jgi:hypothetical protein
MNGFALPARAIRFWSNGATFRITIEQVAP